MDFSDLVEILKKINNQREHPVDDDLLQQIVAIVVKHPLNEDREISQSQIAALINDRAGGE
jgi:hypothetical protein